MRWATPGGLRSLVRDVLGDPVAAGLHVELGTPVDDVKGVRGDADVVVLAMPDPQAARLAPELLAQVGVVENDPTIVVAAAWPTRTWDVRCAFVNDDPRPELRRRRRLPPRRRRPRPRRPLDAGARCPGPRGERAGRWGR